MAAMTPPLPKKAEIRKGIIKFILSIIVGFFLVYFGINKEEERNHKRALKYTNYLISKKIYSITLVGTDTTTILYTGQHGEIWRPLKKLYINGELANSDTIPCIDSLFYKACNIKYYHIWLSDLLLKDSIIYELWPNPQKRRIGKNNVSISEEDLGIYEYYIFARFIYFDKSLSCEKIMKKRIKWSSLIEKGYDVYETRNK